MVKKSLYVMLSLIVLTAGILGVFLIWPTPTLDGKPTMEVIPCGITPGAEPQTEFTARDGNLIPLRVYPSEEVKTAFILLHGGSGCGDYLHPLASYLARESIASVYVPDIRGHGTAPGPIGDIDYIDQLEDDIADLIAHIHQEKNWEQVIIGGHSAGGGLAVRMGGTDYSDMIDGYLLIAPFLGIGVPTDRRSANFIFTNLPRLAALNVLKTIGVTAFDGLKVIHFNWPEKYRDELFTKSYTWRLANGIITADYAADLSAIDDPFILVVGDQDEIVYAENFLKIVKEHVPHGDVKIIPGFNHIVDMINDPGALEIYASWLEEL